MHYRSGTEEQYEEKERLLQEVLDILKEFPENTAKIRSLKESNEKAKGIEIRANAAAKLTDMTDTNKNEEINIIFEYDDPVIDVNDVDSHETAEADLEEETEPEQVETRPSRSGQPTRLQAQAVNNRRVAGVRRKQPVLRNAGLQYLQESRLLEAEMKRKDQVLEERRLSLEEDRLRLEREKFEYEKTEREARMKIEMEERRYNLEVLKQQQNVIDYFIRQTDNGH